MTLKIDKNSRRKQRRKSGNNNKPTAVRSREHSSSSATSMTQNNHHSNNNNNSENEIRNQIQAEFQMLQSLIPDIANEADISEVCNKIFERVGT